MNRKQLTLAVVCLLVLGVGTVRAGAAVKDFASYVPKDTMIYVEIDNDPVKIKAMKKSVASRLNNDPRCVKLLEEALEQYDVIMSGMGCSLKEAGISAKDIVNLEEGGIALAFWVATKTMPSGAQSPYPFPQAAILFDLSTPASKTAWEKTNALLDGFVKKGTFTPSEQTIEGLKARVLALKDAHTEEMVKPTLLQKGDVGILALTPDVMKSILVCMNNGGKGSLAKVENYSKTIGKISDKRLTTAFFNIELFTNMMVSMAGEHIPEEAHQIMFNVLKIDNIRSIGFGSWADSTGSHIDAFMYCPGMQSPLLQPFTSTTEKFALVEGVSKYATGFVAMSIDPVASYKMLQNVVKQSVGEEMFKALMDQLAEQEKQMGFSIENDLIAGLGNEVLFSMPSLSIDVAVPAFVMAVEVKDRAKIEKVLNIAIAGINSLIEQHNTTGMNLKIKFAEKKIGKDTIYYNVIGGAYCFKGKYLIVGSSADRIEQFIDSMNGDNPSITDKAEYKKAMRVLGGKNNMFGYMNMEHLYRLMGLMHYLQGFVEKMKENDKRPEMMQPGAWPEEGDEEWDEAWPEEGDEEWDEEDMPEEPGEPEAPAQPSNPAGADDGDSKDEPEPHPGDAIEKAVARLGEINQDVMAITAEYMKACFFVLRPEKDGLRLQTYIP